MAHALATLTLALSAFLSLTGTAAESPELLAAQFLRNAHTGVPMNGSQWLTKAMLKPNMFTGFGGLDRLIEQSTKLANDYGGLKDIRVLRTQRKQGTTVVTVQVSFVRDPQLDPNAPTALKEPMIWEMKVKQESGHSRLEF